MDVEGSRASVSYMDLFQAVVRAVGQYDLHSNHTGLVQTGLPGEMVLSRQALSSHVVKQLVGFHRAKGWRVDLQRNMRERGKCLMMHLKSHW